MNHVHQDLTDRSYRHMIETFASRPGRRHCPSEKMLRGLRSLLETITAMLAGDAAPMFFLSSLEPGIGKTTAITSWLRTYMQDPVQYGDAGVLIGLDRTEEIRALVDAAELPRESFACFVHDDSGSGKHKGRDLNELGLGKERAIEARVLFTTKQAILLRSAGRSFGSLKTFHYLGNPRPVRIWDESLTVGKPLTLDRGMLHSLVGHLITRREAEQSQAMEQLIAELGGLSDGQTFQVPPLAIRPDLFAGHFARAPWSVRQMADTLATMAGTVVTVRKDNNPSEKNQRKEVLLDCVRGLPEDFAPCLITDASGIIRHTYRLQERELKNLFRLPPDEPCKRYGQLDIRIWRKGSGKSSYENVAFLEQVATEVVKLIRSRPGEQFLVVHFLEVPLPEAILSKLTTAEEKDRVAFLHYGLHTATNAYADVPNVVLTGVVNYALAEYEVQARAAAVKRTVDGKLDADDLRRFRCAEFAHHVYQAACRGLVRKAEGDQCPESRLWLIARQQTGLEAALKRLFPGCHLGFWDVAEKVPTIRGKTKEAYGYIKRRIIEEGSRVLYSSEVQRHVDMGTSNFRTCVRHNLALREALGKADVALVQLPGGRWAWLREDFESFFGDTEEAA